MPDEVNLAVQHMYLLVVCLWEDVCYHGCHRLPFVVISSRCTGTAPNKLDGIVSAHQTAAGIFTCGTVRKPEASFHFFYIDTDSNKCIFSPYKGWERLWFVFVCSCLRGMTMNATDSKSLLFLDILAVLCLCFDSLIEIETSCWLHGRDSDNSRLDCCCGVSRC